LVEAAGFNAMKKAVEQLMPVLGHLKGGGQ
jgi:hypothetical protein